MKQPGRELLPLFEDNHLLIVSKPAGMATQIGPHDPESLETDVKLFLKEKYQKKGNVFCQPIHRLDKVTSGLVLFAKTSKAATRLYEMQRSHKIEKKYLAVVEGTLDKSQGELTHFLVHDHMMARIVDKSFSGAQKCVLHFKVLGQEKTMTLVLVSLETGRYHQIRAQFSAIGHPIIGDHKYGSHTPFKNGAIALHAAFLQFLHPVTKEPISITDYPPKEAFPLWFFRREDGDF
jgi:23S rRNA pseudouridine1911/1915/1917 synthase